MKIFIYDIVCENEIKTKEFRACGCLQAPSIEDARSLIRMYYTAHKPLTNIENVYKVLYWTKLEEIALTIGTSARMIPIMWEERK